MSIQLLDLHRYAYVYVDTSRSSLTAQHIENNESSSSSSSSSASINYSLHFDPEVEELLIDHLLLSSKAKNIIAAFGTERAIWIPIPVLFPITRKKSKSSWM